MLHYCRDYINLVTKENLEGVDVIEEKDGITISDAFEGNSLFISDDDLPYLYEILKDRFISKYWKFFNVFQDIK